MPFTITLTYYELSLLRSAVGTAIKEAERRARETTGPYSGPSSGWSERLRRLDTLFELLPDPDDPEEPPTT